MAKRNFMLATKSARCLLIVALCLSLWPGLVFAKGADRVLVKQALDQATLAANSQQLPGDRSALKRRIAILTSRLDVPAAVQQCKTIAGASDSVRALGQAASALAPQDSKQASTLIVGALSYSRGISSDFQRTSELTYLACTTAAFDASGALALAHELKDPEAFFYVWHEIARQAPQAALADLKKKPVSPERQLAAIIPVLAQSDLPGALAQADKLTDPLLKAQVLAQSCAELAPEDALAVAQRIADDTLRFQTLRAAAGRLALTNPAAALQAIAELPDSTGSALAIVALAASATDPQQAVKLLGQITSPRVRVDALGVLVLNLLAKDPPAALALAQSEPELPTWVLPQLWGALAQADLPAARAKAAALADPFDRDVAHAAIAQAIASQAPGEAQELIREIQNPSLRLPALRALIISIAHTDITQARNLVGLATDPRQVRLLLCAAAQAAAPQQPTQAIELLKKLPAFPERTEALLEIAAALAPTDLKGGLAVAKLALEESAAAHLLASRLAPRDPELALSCAATISQPLRRGHAFCDIAEVILTGPIGPAGQPVARPEVQRIIEYAVPATNNHAGSLAIVAALPHQLKVRLPNSEPGLYTVRYQQGPNTFVWENLTPGSDGAMLLQDDAHLQPTQRLRCPSRGTATDPAFFNDFTKAPLVDKSRAPFGIPVSTFGGPGYLTSAPTWLHRDSVGNFWLYQDQRPWRISAFDRSFNYRFTLLFPRRILALDSDPQANLYVLQEGNYLSRFDAAGRPENHWQLRVGRGPNQFIAASGLALDPSGAYLYLADRQLGRVQRFDLALRPVPFTFVPWGWIGREDLSYLKVGSYSTENRYRLDRPARLVCTSAGQLYVDCAYYLMRFDLNSGRQLPFGKNEVLGWGGSFSNSPHTAAAANDGLWHEHALAGVDPEGKIYISDTRNAFLASLRLQVFSANGDPLAQYDCATNLQDAAGRRVYLTPPLALAFAPANEGVSVWSPEAGGHVYQSAGLAGGGQLLLGPGAPDKQFDLTQISAADLQPEKQAGWQARKVEGLVYAATPGRAGTSNCEAEHNATLAPGATSLWLPVRLGEPFQLTLLEAGREMLPGNYTVELESQPGPFGTQYDFFRVTNKSGHEWKNVRFVAESLPPTVN